MTKNTPQIKAAKTRRSRSNNRQMLAYLAAFVMGGIVPATTFAVAHTQIVNIFHATWDCEMIITTMIKMSVVLGGLVYSAPTVVQWFSRYVGITKAVGFVLCLEAAMTFTNLATAIPALIVLVVVNGLILGNKFTND